MPVLYCFSGLPGTGKSTLARALAAHRACVYLRIDTIEQALRDAGVPPGGPEGYLTAYEIAVDNLRLGTDVVADSVNPIAVTRNAWRAVAERSQAAMVEIELICSDANEHRRRVETRSTDIPNLYRPSWSEVQGRQYDRWDRPHFVIDTAGQGAEASLNTLQRLLTDHHGGGHPGR